VEDIEPQAINLDNGRFWNSRGPCLLVIITTHRNHRCYGLQRCQDCGVTNVSGMNDTRSPRQRSKSLRAHKAMRI
jgi:hypothetical protein